MYTNEAIEVERISFIASDRLYIGAVRVMVPSDGLESGEEEHAFEDYIEITVRIAGNGTEPFRDIEAKLKRAAARSLGVAKGLLE